MVYIEASDVRNASGITTDLISDVALADLIGYVEKMTENWLNAKFTMTETIDILDGNALNYIYTNKNPVWKVVKLVSDDTTADLEYVKVYKESGKLLLDTGGTISYFNRKPQKVIIKYLHAWLDYDGTNETSTTSASATGTSVALAVSSESGFTADDYIEIYGTDGNRETAKVTATDTNEITVDQLNFTHESGSVIKKLAIPDKIKRYMIVEAAIAAAVNVIGGTYNFNTSYGLGELNVTKGVPYPHFTSQYDKLLKERELLRASLKPRPFIRM